MDSSKLVELFESIDTLNEQEVEVMFKYLHHYMKQTMNRLNEADDTLEMEKISEDYLYELQSITSLFQNNCCVQHLSVGQYSRFVEIIYEMTLALLELQNQTYCDCIPLEQLATINHIVLQSLDQLYQLEVVHHKEILCKQLFLCWKHFRHVLHRMNISDTPINKEIKKKIQKQADHFMMLLELAENNCRKYHHDDIERIESRLRFKMDLIQHFQWIKPVYKKVMTRIQREIFALKHPLFARLAEEHD